MALEDASCAARKHWDRDLTMRIDLVKVPVDGNVDGSNEFWFVRPMRGGVVGERV